MPPPSLCAAHGFGQFGRLMRPRYACALVAVFAALWPGCAKRWDHAKAPRGHAIIRDRVINIPWNRPPIETHFVFSILEVDGAPPGRERIPPLVDAQPGVELTAGRHTIRARIDYRPLPKDIDPKTHVPVVPADWRQPKEVVFEKDLADGAVSFLIGDASANPVLVADNPQAP